MRRPARSAGFTLVELLLGTALLVIFFGAIAIIVQIAAQLLAEGRVKANALTLAQEKLELARNLSYTEVGTVGGIPDGPIEPSEIVPSGSLNYTVATTVVYVDDLFDDVAPTDALPNDYKRVQVEVTWDGPYASNEPVTLVSDVAPKGSETDISGGTITITVYNASGVVVSGANVHLQAPSLSPPVDMNLLTDIDGRVSLPGAPECTECYSVTVTKSGYTTDRTYTTVEVANPNRPPLSVIEGDLTEVSFAIDVTSTLTVRATRTAAFNYAPFQGVEFVITGAKSIGRDIYDQPVPKYTTSVITGIGGQVVVPNVEWDSYTIDAPVGSSIDLAGSWPFNPFPVLPGGSVTFTGVAAATSANNVLVIAKDSASQPFYGVTVTLENPALPYIATKSTPLTFVPDVSQAFFSALPTTETPYTLTLQAAGMATASSQATISGSVVERYILSP